MRDTVFTFAKIQSHLLNATYYSYTSKTYASDYVCTRIFLSCFNTSLSINNNILIRLCCQVFLHMCKPGKSDMFSAKVKTLT